MNLNERFRNSISFLRMRCLLTGLLLLGLICPATAQTTESYRTSSFAESPASHQTEIPGAWPTQPTTFDSRIQAAGCSMIPDSGNAEIKHQNSLESWLDKIGPAVSNVKTTIQKKSSQWLGHSSSSAKTSKLDVKRMLTSLALVIGCYLGFVWVVRKISPGGNRSLPVEVVQILGRLPFGTKQHLQLVRLGSKLLLLLVGPDGAHSIGEVSDPHEVEQLMALCRSKRPVQIPINHWTPAPPSHSRSEPNMNAPSPGLARVLQSLENSNHRSGHTSIDA